jgi:hypothetical protein
MAAKSFITLAQASFSWMLVEGIHVYYMLVKVNYINQLYFTH